jgi:nitroreductase
MCKEGVSVNIDEFVDLARKRRSVRRFKTTPIPDECIEKVIEAAR